MGSFTGSAAGGVELAAFVEECEATEATLHAAAGADAERPGLGEWTLAELAGHLVVVAGRMEELGAAGPVAGPPVLDRFGYFPVATATARVDAPPLPAAAWGPRFAERWRASARRFEALGARAVIDTPAEPMLAVEFLATRVLEVVVHHMDVRRALDEPPAATPDAGRVTLALLEGMLDGPRPRNLGRTRFILAATGRVDVDDPRLPLLR